MPAAMETVQIGAQCDIKRSDGRIHSAVISGINHETQSVTVEWFERGETKGKEIDYSQLVELNPQFAENNVAATTSAVDRKHMRLTNFMLPDPPEPPQLMYQDSRKTIGAPLKQTNSVQANTKLKTAPKAVSPQNGHDDGLMLPAITSREKTTVTDKNASNKRRSNNVVSTIEAIKQNRVDRRAQQQELKEKKAELMQLEPGNPNWEFLGMIREYQEQLEYHPLRATDSVGEHRICVCVRKRPMNSKENGRKEIDVVTIPTKDHMIVHQPMAKVDLTKYLENQMFRFDYAFDENVTNEVVYKFTAQPLVRTIFDKGFATCFAYGQTGSGKTHTMGGDFHGKTQDCTKGIYAFTARDVFRLLHKNKQSSLGVSCSFFEIYSGKVFDLLNNKAKLRVLEDGKQQVQVCGLSEINVEQEEDVLKLIQRGNEQRTAGQTSANNHSSRSHAVFQIILREKKSKKLHGKFSLIDLAGNERGADTSSSNRNTRMEGAEINKSLLALKECIRALGRKNAHLPFRASKLTLVLRDSFVGDNAKTCMIAMISPGMNSCEHTLNTLRYADRVKELGADQEAGMRAGGSGDEDYPMGDNQNDSEDLALLRSKNEEELTNELYKYNIGMDHLQEIEEQVVEEHHRVIESTQKWLDKNQKLIKQTNVVDYDVEDYAKELEGLLDQKIAKLQKLRDMVRDFRQDLNQEEQLAQTIKRVPRNK